MSAAADIVQPWLDKLDDAEDLLEEIRPVIERYAERHAREAKRQRDTGKDRINPNPRIFHDHRVQFARAWLARVDALLEDE